MGYFNKRWTKMFKLYHLEEVKVVTRYPYVNLRMDHYRKVTQNMLFMYVISKEGAL